MNEETKETLVHDDLAAFSEFACGLGAGSGQPERPRCRRRNCARGLRVRLLDFGPLCPPTGGSLVKLRHYPERHKV
jgi:hypothetical protein